MSKSNCASLTWISGKRTFRARQEVNSGMTFWRYTVSDYGDRGFMAVGHPTDTEDQIRTRVEADLAREELGWIKDAADGRFLGLAVQYYVAARSAARAGLTPVCGNLFHHAIEMFLKARLVRKCTALSELKRYSHDLPKTWNAFKAEFPTVQLTQFDGLIATLHEFESLRYPDEAAMKQGAQLSIKWYPTSYVTGIVAPDAPPLYEITVSELDELVAKLFEVSSRNPRAFLGHLNEYARDILEHNNRVGDQLLG